MTNQVEAFLSAFPAPAVFVFRHDCKLKSGKEFSSKRIIIIIIKMTEVNIIGGHVTGEEISRILESAVERMTYLGTGFAFLSLISKTDKNSSDPQKEEQVMEKEEIIEKSANRNLKLIILNIFLVCLTFGLFVFLCFSLAQCVPKE